MTSKLRRLYCSAFNRLVILPAIWNRAIAAFTHILRRLLRLLLTGNCFVNTVSTGRNNAYCMVFLTHVRGSFDLKYQIIHSRSAV
jgi:hypothetical protein